MIGGTFISLSTGVLEKFSDPGAVWIMQIPVEPNEFEKAHPEAWPRERHFRIMHDCYVGTVDEIAEDFKRKLVTAWDAFTVKSADGSQPDIPSFGEPSLRKQTELLERHGLNRFVCGSELKADKADLERREAKRIELSGFTPQQDAWTRWELMRLVGQYGSCRRFGSDGGFGCPPTDNAESIQQLIDDLTVLKNDKLAQEKHAKEKA